MYDYNKFIQKSVQRTYDKETKDLNLNISVITNARIKHINLFTLRLGTNIPELYIYIPLNLTGLDSVLAYPVQWSIYKNKNNFMYYVEKGIICIILYHGEYYFYHKEEGICVDIQNQSVDIKYLIPKEAIAEIEATCIPPVVKYYQLLCMLVNYKELLIYPSYFGVFTAMLPEILQKYKSYLKKLAIYNINLYTWNFINEHLPQDINASIYISETDISLLQKIQQTRPFQIFISGKNERMVSYISETENKIKDLFNKLKREVFLKIVNGITSPLQIGDINIHNNEITLTGDFIINPELTLLPLKIQNIHGSLFCIHSKLVSLENFPHKISGDLHLENCLHLQSLKYLPNKIYGTLHIKNVPVKSLILLKNSTIYNAHIQNIQTISSLDGLQYIRDLVCIDNVKIKNLEGLPFKCETVKLHNMQLTDLKGISTKLINLYILNCNIDTLENGRYYRNLHIEKSKLYSLNGISNIIDGDFTLKDTHIEYPEIFPQKIKGQFINT